MLGQQYEKNLQNLSENLSEKTFQNWYPGLIPRLYL